MIPILYDTNETAFTSNGLCRLRDCIEAVVTEERNGVYEFDFTYPVDGANYNLIQPGKIVGVTHDDTGDVQPFDIVSYSKPIDGIMTFHCVHISYRLNGISFYVMGQTVNDLTSAITMMNAGGSPFTFSADFTANGYCSAFGETPRTVRQMLGGVEGSMLDTYGGEYRWDKFSVEFLRARGKARDLTIRYGVNMLDCKDDVDYEGTYNKVIPYWTGNDSVVVGATVSSGLPTYSGRDITIPLDLTDKFENTPTSTQLVNLATSMLHRSRPTIPQQNISVEFIRLQDMEEYSQFAGLMTCELCDTINVALPYNGGVGQFKIVKTVWNVLEDKFDSMELGDLSTSLSEALGITESATNPKNPAEWYDSQNDQGCVVIGDMLIQWGTKSVTSGSSGTTSGGITTYAGSESVGFTKSFKYDPVVTISFSTNYANQVTTEATGVSTTGFNAYVRLLTASTARSVQWIAVGQKG